MTQCRQQKRPPAPGTMSYRIVQTLVTAPEDELTTRQLRIRCGVQDGTVNRTAYLSFTGIVSQLAHIGLIHHTGRGLYSAMEDA